MPDPAVPDRYLSRLGIFFVIDTNLVDEESPEMDELRSLHEQGWFDLTRTDVMDTELRRAPDLKRARLLSLSGQYVEHQQPVALGGDDRNRLDRLFSILFPGQEWAATRSSNCRDTAHVAMAIRYGAKGFLTRDRGLLGKAGEVKAAFDSFTIGEPAWALAFVQRLRARYEVRTRDQDSTPQRPDLASRVAGPGTSSPRKGV